MELSPNCRLTEVKDRFIANLQQRERVRRLYISIRLKRLTRDIMKIERDWALDVTTEGIENLAYDKYNARTMMLSVVIMQFKRDMARMEGRGREKLNNALDEYYMNISEDGIC